jgi:hypothetical protein
MPHFNWNFRTAFPGLFSLAQRPLPASLNVTFQGETLTTADLDPDGESYSIQIPADIEVLLHTGELRLQPAYHNVDGSDPSGFSGSIHFFGLDFVVVDHPVL